MPDKSRLSSRGAQSLLANGFGVPSVQQGMATRFANRWDGYSGTEVAHYQSHFNGLCELVEHEKPEDRLGSISNNDFDFQKAAPTPDDRNGKADVFLRDRFVMEYKRPDSSLDQAYFQVLRYRDSLGNPPLLLVSDFETIRIHTNFTGTVSETYYLERSELRDLEGLVRHRNALGVESRGPLTVAEVLLACFHAPHRLKPTDTPEGLTESAAEIFKEVADQLNKLNEGKDAEIAKFLSQILFTMFASDMGLLSRLKVTEMSEELGNRPSEMFAGRLANLIGKMSEGAKFDIPPIPHFNGGIFDGVPVDIKHTATVVPFLREADRLDWSQIEPSIFGTLFERVFNPEKRAQFGRHYTPRADIEQLIEPVVMSPLREEWDELKNRPITGDNTDAVADGLQSFVDRIGSWRILDPACGSGNFLYVTLNLLHQLEREVIRFAHDNDIVAPEPRVHPRQLFGIELDEYAHQLANVVVWIGHIQNGARAGMNILRRDPILDPLDNIHCHNAIVTEEGEPAIPDWPDAECIVSNPPFLGNRRMREALGDAEVERIYSTWKDLVPNSADYCMYWFEKARQQIVDGKAKRAGLLGTQAIRGQSSRGVLDRILASGGIFFAVSDQVWRQDSASVQISMVGFDDGSQTRKMLDGREVSVIQPNLTSLQVDITEAKPLSANVGIAFQGVIKSNDFVVSEQQAKRWIAMTSSPKAIRDNKDILKPLVIGRDLNGHNSKNWVIDFGVDMSHREAMRYMFPYEYLKKVVGKGANGSDKWWLFQSARPGMRAALSKYNRYIATSRVSKHRIFVWIDSDVLPDSTTVVFATDDDYDFGILQSRIHEVWSTANGAQLRELESGRRYMQTTCFNTFPFPEVNASLQETIREAARNLVVSRESWLAAGGSPEPGERDDRTLTALYNEFPDELAECHATLDRAVFDAYGWSEVPSELADDAILERLLKLNLEREAA